MVMKLNAGEVGRSDMFSFFPEHVLIVHAENSRIVPHTPEEITALAASISQYGQQQPAVVRRINDNKVQLVSGYGRHQAISLLNSQNPDKPIKLQCRVLDLNAEEAFVRSIVENNDRKGTNAVDDAHAQRRLRDDFGWSESRIAEFYEQSVSYVGQLRKVLQLSGPLQAEVINGNLPVSVALDVVQLPEEERSTVVAEAKNPATGKVNGNKVRAKVREQKIEKNEAKSRTMKEVREFFEALTGPAEKDTVRKMAKKMGDFLCGKITDERMTNFLNTIGTF